MAEVYCTGTMTDGSRAVFRIEQPMETGFVGRVVSRTPDGILCKSGFIPWAVCRDKRYATPTAAEESL